MTHNPAIRQALEAIWAVLPEDPNRQLGVFDHLADIDRENGGSVEPSEVERLPAPTGLQVAVDYARKHYDV